MLGRIRFARRGAAAIAMDGGSAGNAGAFSGLRPKFNPISQGRSSAPTSKHYARRGKQRPYVQALR